jgi:glutamyl-tRNA reductase
VDPELDLLLVGLSHRTAPVAVRERVSVAAGDLPARLRTALGASGVVEATVLSTCNRTEVLVATKVGHATPDLAERLRAEHLAAAEADSVYSFQGAHAAIHLFRVAAGLDSLVLGESQILAQVKQAWEAARRAGTTGALLDPLMRQALSVGKRIRNETSVGEGTLSVARVGVDIARQVFGDFRGTTALIVGAGETALLVARHLAESGTVDLVFANRTLERAEAAAAELGGRAAPLHDLPVLLRDADLVLPCIDGAPGTLRRKFYDRRALRRRDRPQLVIDLSVPRAAEEGLSDLEGLLYYDLDDLASVVEENRRERERATEGSDEILVAELHKFLSLRTFAAFTPVISELRSDFDAVCDSILEDGRGGSEELVTELKKRLLDAALRRFKEGAQQARPQEAISREYQRFLERL